MKLLLVLTAIVGLGSCTSAVSGQSRHHDFDDILARLPTKELVAVIRKHLDAGNPSLTAIHRYVQSDEFSAWIWRLIDSPSFVNVVNALEKNNANLKDILNSLAAVVGIDLSETLKIAPHSAVTSTASWQEIYRELNTLIYWPRVQSTIGEKIATSRDVNAAWSIITSPYTQINFNRMLEWPETQTLLSTLVINGFDLDLAFQAIHKF